MPSGDPQEIKALPRLLAVEDADVEARRNRRRAAEALFEAMDGGLFDLDLAAIDRLNAIRVVPSS
jgi:hypothetical protein